MGKLPRRKLECAAAQHGGGDAGHEGLRLEVMITKHFVGAPAADHTDAVAVDSGAEESHGAARAGRAGGDIWRGVRRIGLDREGSANARREPARGDKTKGAAGSGRTERIEGGRGWSP